MRELGSVRAFLVVFGDFTRFEMIDIFSNLEDTFLEPSVFCFSPSVFSSVTVTFLALSCSRLDERPL